jgi:hypothetical protein
MLQRRFTLVSRSLTLTGALALSGCLNPYGGPADTDTDAGSTGGASTGDTTGPGPTSTTVTPTTGTEATDGGEPVCGDMLVEGDEECDNGPANADDADCTAACKMASCGDALVNKNSEECDAGPDNADDAACTSTCKTAVCGDQLVQKDVEVCDDGVNDGEYGGCAVDCTAVAPRCGDLNVDTGFEECDGDAACLPATCLYANSCVDYKQADPQSPSGPYLIRRDDVPEPLQVWCEMADEVDGGGYTFLKVDVDSETNDFPYPAKKAETECQKYGMQLFIPRSMLHLKSAYAVATTENIIPFGGGTIPAGSDYLRILGIYPVMPGTSCVDKAINSVDCVEWAASDTQVYWVSGAPVGVGEPDPDGTCAGCSMSYTWNADASVKKYVAIPDVGGSSFRFMCDTGDKLP